MEIDPARQERPLVAPADFLTGARIPLSLAFLMFDGVPVRLGILSVFIATDVLDGVWARAVGGSRVGAVLDPICDKLFMVAAFWVVLQSGVLSAWEILAVLLRDIVAAAGLLVVTLMGKPTTLPSRAGGKAVTVAQVLTLVAFVAGSETTVPLAWATGAISIYAIWDYSAVYGKMSRTGDPNG